MYYTIKYDTVLYKQYYILQYEIFSFENVNNFIILKEVLKTYFSAHFKSNIELKFVTNYQ